MDSRKSGSSPLLLIIVVSCMTATENLDDLHMQIDDQRYHYPLATDQIVSRIRNG